MTPIFAMFGLGPMEIGALLVLGVLLFGRRLPEVGRHLGKGIVEFKKGLKGLEDEVESSSAMSSPPSTQAPSQIESPRPPQKVSATAPKFDDGVITNPPPQG